jgi:purine-binding chemotaxis protein CheW
VSETATWTQQLNEAIMEKENKYPTFALFNGEYGLETLKVCEIISHIEITAVPQTPDYVKGVINLRGQVIPVVDLRAKFGSEATEVTEETCIIVVEVSRGSHKFSAGVVDNHVLEVSDIEESPQTGSSFNTNFILGLGKIGESIKILLDIDSVLTSKDFSRFADDPIDDSNMQEGSNKDGQM